MLKGKGTRVRRRPTAACCAIPHAQRSARSSWQCRAWPTEPRGRSSSLPSHALRRRDYANAADRSQLTAALTTPRRHRHCSSKERKANVNSRSKIGHAQIQIRPPRVETGQHQQSHGQTARSWSSPYEAAMKPPAETGRRRRARALDGGRDKQAEPDRQDVAYHCMKIGAWSGQSAQLRQHAAECDRLAEETDDVVARQYLTELATEFRTLADEIDESKPGDEAGEH